MFGFVSVGLFSSIGINVVNHGRSITARKTIWVLNMVANEVVINISEFIPLSHSCKAVPTEGITQGFTQSALSLSHCARCPWARLPSSKSSSSPIGQTLRRLYLHSPSWVPKPDPDPCCLLLLDIYLHVAYSNHPTRSLPLSSVLSNSENVPHPPKC